VRFENGVRLTIKPTKFRDDQVLVKVRIGGGLNSLPADQQSLSWASSAVIEGGLARIDSEDMERVLVSKVYAARFGIEDDAYVLSGGTRPEDISIQMQVLAAYATAPGSTAEDGAGSNGTYTGALARYLATPGLDIKDVFDRTAQEVERVTNGRQRPREDIGLRGRFVMRHFFNIVAAVNPEAASSSPPPDTPAVAVAPTAAFILAEN
jgi:hypothetical protein